MSALGEFIDFLIVVFRNLLLTLNSNWILTCFLYLAILSVMVTVLLIVRGGR